MIKAVLTKAEIYKRAVGEIGGGVEIHCRAGGQIAICPYGRGGMSAYATASEMDVNKSFTIVYTRKRTFNRKLDI